MKKFILTIAALVAFSSAAIAADNMDTALADAKIIQPIKITKTADMSFGSFTIDAPTATITASGDTNPIGFKPDGSGTIIGTNSGITQTGTPTHAVFKIEGESGAAFDIDVPNTFTLNGPLSASMEVQVIIDGMSAAISTLSPNISVHGMITTTNTQTPGTYNGSFDMTVNYQ